MVSGAADSIRMEMTPMYSRASAVGKSFESVWRARSSRNVIILVTMKFVATVRKVDAAEYLEASTPVVSV
jgi:hypothetical protein